MTSGWRWAWKVPFEVMLLAEATAGRQDARAQKSASSSEAEKVIFDTDIGDGIDDGFALALSRYRSCISSA
jgi:hypothetical protein